MHWFFIFSLTLFSSLFSSVIEEKVLFCGIAKNVERAVPMTIQSMETMGSYFKDYQVVIYENNSVDKTKDLLQLWEKENRRVLFLSEDLSPEELSAIAPFASGAAKRVAYIAAARNKLLNELLKPEYDDVKYVILADLDFQTPWNYDAILETILHPECEWDAVFAYGMIDYEKMYDLFAYRAPDHTIGFEHLGDEFFTYCPDLFYQIIWTEEEPWHKVYSAFGGLGIYKRETMKNSYYTSTITNEFEKLSVKWLGEDLLQSDYRTDRYFSNRRDNSMPFAIGEGELRPWTCEHILFHAQMITNGYDKLYINPKLRMNYFVW